MQRLLSSTQSKANLRCCQRVSCSSQSLNQRVFARPQALHSSHFSPCKPTVAAPLSKRRPSRQQRLQVCSAIPGELIGVGLFFTPGLLAVAYAFVKGKGNLKDGLSRLLTDISQGYFQPNVGGETIPVAEGELSDLAGDEPLFMALYKW